ncbi:protein MICROTUBULE BINDING PROTEIN 2C-like [Olea europaea var. sylvestris]|uniref:protein MICROTUBULE BINDING PROTEIN 2C-like n=1 Tax=Olea europaea var. sylvestris TaxID=158386 RepID=UPI000C1D36F6|nr:protein MICROTUBULE BINDING PROTEIN 2C-like [Olea europaea var. sylvestris]
MYEQHLLDLQDNNGFGSDPKSWLSDGNSGVGGEGHSSLASTLSSVSAAAANASAASNVDRVLFNDLVEIVPLVQSLIDRKANTSFTRRGSIIYTKTPTKESIYKKEEHLIPTRDLTGGSGANEAEG